MTVTHTDILRYARSAEDGFAEAVKRMEASELRILIDKADAAYYRPGIGAIMSDAEYDLLKPALKILAPDDERITRVGPQYDAAELRNKVTHNIPMGSLDNTDNGIAGYTDWYEKICHQLGVAQVDVLVSLKVDGASVCMTYGGDGKLQRVATRGNGTVGENITINGANFQNVPTVIAGGYDVRGEAILYVKDYQEIRARDAGVPFDQIPERDRGNPRNDGNGILGRDDGKDSNRIRVIGFNIYGTDATTEQEKMDKMRELGFQPVPYKLCKTVEEVVAFHDEVLANRAKLPFEIDGIVVVVNSLEHQKRFITADPKTQLRPKFARAIKFPHKFGHTVLNGVTLTVGHTGAIIPTAQLAEVRIGGVNVTNALLNNWDEIGRLGVAVGDTVEVVLAGDIIPKVTRCVSAGANRVAIAEPHRCPICGEPTTREFRGKKGAVTYCASKQKCPAALYAKIDHWIGTSKKGTGILHIGDTILKALWDNQLVNDPADLYTLTVDQIKDVQLDGGGRIGESRATTIIQQIAAKRVLPLSMFLGALGIDLLGRRRAIILMEAARGELEKLDDWLDDAKLASIQIEGFGDSIRASIRAGIDECRPLIKKLLSVGVVVLDFSAAILTPSDTKDEEKATGEAPATDATRPTGLPFSGWSFCFTGTRAYIDDVVRLGGEIKSGVSRGLTFLVQKDPMSRSNKTQKAESYGTTIVGIDYLKQAIDGKVTLAPKPQPQQTDE